MYICVCFIWNQYNTSNIQHGVRIEAVFASLQQGEHTDRIQQFSAYIQASWSFYKFYKIEFFYKEEEKGPRRDTSQSLNTVFSTVFPVSPHPIQGKDRIFILLQEDSSNFTKNTSTTRLIPCTQTWDILQQLFPIHSSILHSRIRLQAPYSTPRLPVILPTETAF